jgi:16S rRNA (guanine527-N7)-methyltransferase
VNGLETLLTEARELGFLGAQPIDRQIEHANGFADVCEAVLGPVPEHGVASPPDERNASPEPRLLDLGAGGGLPGLVLATQPRGAGFRIVLLDVSQRRTEWLRRAVEQLGLASRVEVLAARAEDAGQSGLQRHRYLVVVARSFGRPAVTAECAASLLQVGGVLIVSEPPVGYDSDPVPSKAESGTRCLDSGPEVERRWPVAGLAELGLSPAQEWRARGFHYAVLRAERACGDRYPRRNGVPAKRPLF